MFLCELKGSIRSDADKCQVTQPCSFFKHALSWCKKGPKAWGTLSVAEREGRCAEAWSGTWQANSNCVMLHGKNVCRSTLWRHVLVEAGRGIFPLNLCTRWGWVVGFMVRPLYPQNESQSPAPVWTFYADVVSCLGVGDPDSKLVLQRQYLEHPTPCGPLKNPTEPHLFNINYNSPLCQPLTTPS